MAQLKKLTQQQYYELETQYLKTPDPSDGGGSGEHMILSMILRRCGYREEQRLHAYRLAEKLLAMGYDNEQ